MVGIPTTDHLTIIHITYSGDIKMETLLLTIMLVLVSFALFRRMRKQMDAKVPRLKIHQDEINLSYSLLVKVLTILLIACLIRDYFNIN